jgi:uncharacterized protein
MIRSCFAGALGLGLLVSACDYAPAQTGTPAKSGAVSKGRPHTEDGHAPNSLPRGKVFLASGAREIPVKVEIAATPPTRQRGLMFRQSLPENEGMLFLFPASEPLSFWMKNTYLPLDMIFIKLSMSERLTPPLRGATKSAQGRRFVLKGQNLSR